MKIGELHLKTPISEYWDPIVNISASGSRKRNLQQEQKKKNISYSCIKNLELYIAQHDNITLIKYLNTLSNDINTDKKWNC